MSEVVEADLCTGCGTCVSLCPKEALKMVVDKKRGIYVPEININKCIDCGLCYKTCPGKEVDFKKLNIELFGKEPENILLGNYQEVYLGQAKDQDILYNSSSGGLITQILISALETGVITGALVTKMSKEEPLRPEPFIARTKEEIIEASRSKYCPVPANVVLKEIMDSEDGEKIAVVGLPCHIQAIRKAEQINKKLKAKIAFHLGLFCASTKNFWGTEYQLKRMLINKENVCEIRYRGEGWPGYMTIYLRNGSTVSVPYPMYSDNKFSSFTPWRCTVCPDETSELADISFGDPWLPELKCYEGEGGISMLISRTAIGEKLLQEFLDKEFIWLKSINAEKVVESQGGIQRKRLLKPRLVISKKLFNKKIPNYVLPEYNFRYSLSDYLITTLVYFKQFLLIRPRLWWMFEIYCNTLQYLGKRMKKISRD